jgi:hypothetical protein
VNGSMPLDPEVEAKEAAEKTQDNQDKKPDQ